MMFAFVSLLFLRRARKGLRGMSRTEVVKIGLNGGLLALHWVAFYAAIKMANPTIALVGLSTTSFFTAIFEPILSRKAIVWPDVFIGFVAIPGMILIYKNVDFQMVTGLWVGIGAAVVLAIFSIISKKQIVSIVPVTEKSKLKEIHEQFRAAASGIELPKANPLELKELEKKLKGQGQGGAGEPGLIL